jgi:hypothetical protein
MAEALIKVLRLDQSLTATVNRHVLAITGGSDHMASRDYR